jgi:hypothetical protein
MADQYPSSGFVPIVNTFFYLEGLFSEEKYQQLVASKVLDTGTIDGTVSKGDYVTIPRVVQAADFSRVVLTDTAAAAGTRIASNSGVLSVLRDASINTLTKHDELRTGADFQAMLARSAGNKFAKRMISQLDNSLKGALNSYSIHTKALGNNPITVQGVRAAKAKLGDQGQNLRTMLMHSSVWYDLVYDLVQNYKYMGVTSGTIIEEGKLDTIMGVRNIIISDDITPDAGYTTSSQAIYPTYLLGENSIYLAWQREVETEEFLDSRVPSTLHYIKFSMDYVVGPRAFKFTGGSNPSAGDLADDGNWTASTEDHRNVLAAQILSASGKYA